MSSNTNAAPAEPIQLGNPDEFDDVVDNYDVVLVDFYADWCGPCKMMEPTIGALAADTDAAVLKVDVDQFQALAGQYEVQGIPTLARLRRRRACRANGRRTDRRRAFADHRGLHRVNRRDPVHRPDSRLPTPQ